MEYKKIPGIDDDLYISSKGQLRWRLPDHSQPLPKKCIYEGQYIYWLMVNGKRLKRLVHCMVAELYVPNPNGFNCIEFIDGDHLNPEEDNLRWVKSTPRRHPGGMVLSEERVKSIRARLAKGITGAQIAKEEQISESMVSRIKSGERW